MKNTFKRSIVIYYGILILIALVLGIGITRGTSKQTTPCVDTPGCIMTRENAINGELSTKKRGYPLVVHEKRTFKPTNTKYFAESSVEIQGFSVPYVIINTLFWVALLDGVLRLAKYLRPVRQPMASVIANKNTPPSTPSTSL